MKRFFENLSIHRKLSLLNIVIITVLLLALTFVIFFYQRATILSDNEQRMQNYLQDLENLFELQVFEKQVQVNLSLNMAKEIVSNYGKLIQVDSISVPFSATDQTSGNTEEIILSGWLLGETPLHNDFQLVDKIQQVTQQTSTIFQRIDKGFLRISTNVLKLDGERAVGTYIPNSSPVVKTVLKGETFRGRAFVVDSWYLTAYDPIIINGKVAGALYVGVTEKNIDYLESEFLEKRYFETGFAYAFSGNGEIYIHPSHKDKSIADTDFFKQIDEKEEGTFNGSVFQDGGENIEHYYKYLAAIDTYVAIAVPREELVDDQIQTQLLITLIGALITILIVSISINKVAKHIIITPLVTLQTVLNKLAHREKTEALSTTSDDEIGKINTSLKEVITGLDKASGFAKEVGKGIYDSDFEPLSNEDILGHSLLDMRNNLAQASEEDKKRNWANEGYAKFLDILRKEHEDLSQMSQSVITAMIDYIDANQGAVYVKEEIEEGNKTVLKLVAAYAWDRAKFLDDEFIIDENYATNLTGQTFLEKKTTLLHEVPNDYIKIASGLGAANPSNLILVPLIFNDEIFGVMEIASFGKFEEYKIEFIERVAESLASSISSMGISEKTNRLLIDAQQQSEELRAQEEEMRQNFEELSATQEAQERYKKEMEQREAELLKEIQELKQHGNHET
ncbi:GAF domain-containing protein [Fulvivirga sp. M361]|uniref:Cache 3/Cache 2 fusion domain-containing protein n=1 Tax=Fulvivirga sp. M361 TaxID=2594266 RepID=UPI00117A5565|nr:Cache 3/Cache 2 fusion domain-containing protein [Fulvivirga sp. M361]TRX62563.1 GAF domain-containing protein [Fulvivirga sp. M361]